jgi:molybdopterin converting factor small subunit
VYHLSRTSNLKFALNPIRTRTRTQAQPVLLLVLDRFVVGASTSTISLSKSTSTKNTERPILFIVAKFQILLFAIASDLAGSESIEVETPLPVTAGELLVAIAERVPALTSWLPSCRLAVDRQFVGNEFVLTQVVEVALIPPVSGG